MIFELALAGAYSADPERDAALRRRNLRREIVKLDPDATGLILMDEPALTWVLSLVKRHSEEEK